MLGGQLLDDRSLPGLPRRALLLPVGLFSLVVGRELLTLRLGGVQGVLQRFALGPVLVDERLAAQRLGLLPRGPFNCQVGG